MSSIETALSPEVPRRILVHTSTIAIRWSDMDMLGHVNNTVYFRYMEQGRVYAPTRQVPPALPAKDGA